jgi:hypothetical protein
MIAQQPAEGVFIRKEYNDATYFGVVCDCGSAEHDHNLWVEADDHGVTVTINTQATSKWWEFNRWKQIWKLLTKGYIEYESNLILTEQQALNYSDMLNKAATRVRKPR